ncbi:MAG: hypothetical protein ABIP21_04050 [Acidimicrobiia bacterium]
METNTQPSDTPKPRQRRRRWIATAAVATGAMLGAAGLAGAATGGTSSTTAAPSTAAATPAPDLNGARPDPSTMANGPGETLLTGDDATKAEAAALKALPGATIIRVETDSSGSAYEAHVKKADGTTATVLFDKDFNVTSTSDGFGAGPHGQGPPPGATGTSSNGAAASN